MGTTCQKQVPVLLIFVFRNYKNTVEPCRKHVIVPELPRLDEVPEPFLLLQLQLNDNKMRPHFKLNVRPLSTHHVTTRTRNATLKDAPAHPPTDRLQVILFFIFATQRHSHSPNREVRVLARPSDQLTPWTTGSLHVRPSVFQTWSSGRVSVRHTSKTLSLARGQRILGTGTIGGEEKGFVAGIPRT